MSVLVIGQSGQVARELARLAPEARYLGRDDADLTDPAACAEAVRRRGASVVINAAAYTAVDKAEEEEALAHRINAEAPGAMARAAAESGAVFVQLSTDYVFDGSGSKAWGVDAQARPIGAYGRSKLAGENAVRAAGGVHAILRTAWIFSAHGSNFVKTMLRLSATRDALRIVDDQVGGPTPAADLARACLEIGTQIGTEPHKAGTYHFSGAPDVSWAEFARTIFARAGRSIEVTGIESSDYPTPARRPANARLDCSETETVFGLKRPDWQHGLTEVLAELGVTQ